MQLKILNAKQVPLEEIDPTKFVKAPPIPAEELIKSGEVKIIYTTKDQKENETINKLKETYEVKVVELNTFYTISEEDRKADKTYFDLMYANLELLKEQSSEELQPCVPNAQCFTGSFFPSIVLG